MALNHTAPALDERLPYYLREGDPFASKLSWEADLVAGFYLIIIGKFPCLFSAKAASRKFMGCYVNFAQRFQHLSGYFEMESGRKQEEGEGSQSSYMFHRNDSIIFIIRDKYSLDNPKKFYSKIIYLETIFHFGCFDSRLVYRMTKLMIMSSYLNRMLLLFEKYF